MNVLILDPSFLNKAAKAKEDKDVSLCDFREDKVTIAELFNADPIFYTANGSTYLLKDKFNNATKLIEVAINSLKTAEEIKANLFAEGLDELSRDIPESQHMQVTLPSGRIVTITPMKSMEDVEKWETIECPGCNYPQMGLVTVKEGQIIKFKKCDRCGHEIGISEWNLIG